MLKNKTVSGVIWSAVENVSNQLITFIIGIVLARLLSPEEFGLIGMITIFIGISQILINGGLSDALIRRKNISDSYYNTAFIFNAIISVLLYMALFFIAPYISNFYDRPILTDIIRLLSFTLILNAFTLVQKAQITKAINFKALAKVSLISTIISGFIAIILAYYDYGVWSLVWKNVIQSTITLLVFWKVSGWIPKFQFNKLAFKDMFGFGSRLMILGLIDTAYQNMYFLIIGKYYSAADLGYYTRAETFKRLPSNTLVQIIQRVTYPVLSEIQDNVNSLKSAYRKILQTTMLISILGMMLLSLIAEELTVVLMGEQWVKAGQYLKILCFAGVFYPLDALNSNILKIKNESGKILKIGVCRKMLSIPLVVLMLVYGIEVFLYGLILHQFLAFMMISYYSKRLIDYSTIQQIKDFINYIIISSFVYITIQYGVLELIDIDRFTILTILVFKFFFYFTFTILALIITKNGTFLYLTTIIKQKIWK